MKETDKPKFFEALVVASEFYDKSLSAGALNMYFDTLKDLDIKSVLSAISTHIKTSPYFPKPSDVLRAIEGDPEGRAQRALFYARQAIRRYGAYSSVRFDDPSTMMVIEELGGWPSFCATTEKDGPFVDREFVQRYIHAQRSPRKTLDHLQGVLEQNNGGRFAEWTPSIVEIETTERVALNTKEPVAIAAGRGVK